MKSTAVITLTLAVALCYCATLTQAQRFAPGYCPTVAAHENFDKSKFFGNWIEVEKTPSIFDLMMRCLVVDYSDDQENTVNVVVRGISLAGLPLTVNGDGLLQDAQRSGYYSIRYGFGVPFQGTLTTIIDTDYDDYAVVYSCTNSLLSGVFHSEYIWVLSRSGKISNPTRQNIYEKLDKLAINRSGLTMSDRSSCPANSSTVARESDKDLAAIQGASLAPGSPVNSASGSSASAPIESAPVPVASSAGANLEKASGEQAQKSVVVPLLYDLPSPVSSSSVGSSKSNSIRVSAPVDNKVSQSPSVSISPAPKQTAKPQAVVSASSSVPAAAAPAAATVPQQPSAASPNQPIIPKSANQQPQQQSLMAKIQQKP